MINPLLTGTVTNLDKNLVYNTTMANSLNPKSFPAKVVAAAERTFPFLDLPVEMQVRVVNYIAQPSDLQALCLVSRKVSGIATPRLYYEVNLIPHGRSGLSLSGVGWMEVDFSFGGIEVWARRDAVQILYIHCPSFIPPTKDNYIQFLIKLSHTSSQDRPVPKSH